jgi:hypothetical protein
MKPRGSGRVAKREAKAARRRGRMGMPSGCNESCAGTGGEFVDDGPQHELRPAERPAQLLRRPRPRAPTFGHRELERTLLVVCA